MTELKARYEELNQKVKEDIINEKEISEMIMVLQEMSDDIKKEKNECIKIGKLEFRYSKINKGYEIVHWELDNTRCYVVAFLEVNGGEYDMRTVGNRMFECNKDDFWNVCYQAFEYLNRKYEGVNYDY